MHRLTYDRIADRLLEANARRDALFFASTRRFFSRDAVADVG
jgi:hypothetical protein